MTDKEKLAMLVGYCLSLRSNTEFIKYVNGVQQEELNKLLKEIKGGLND